ncbi:MAG: ATP-binding protein [Bacteroidota bacterium]
MKTSLRLRIYTLFTVGAAGVSLFFYLYLSIQYQEHTYGDARSRAHSITEFASFSITSAVLANDREEIAHRLEPVKKNDDVRFIVVLDSAGKLFYSYNLASAIKHQYTGTADSNAAVNGQSMHVVTIHLTDGVKDVGTMYVGFSLENVREDFQQKRRSAVIISSIVFLIGVVMVYIITRIIVRPIDMIVNAFQRRPGDPFEHVPVTGIAEIDRLGSSFNRIVDDLAAAQRDLHAANRTLEQRVNERTLDLQIEVQHHKDTGAALRESEERYRTLVELSPDAIIVFVGKKFHFINSAVLTVFKSESFDLLRERSLHDFLEAPHVDAFKETLRQLLQRTMVNVHREYPFRRMDGGEFIGEVTATTLIYQGQDAVQIVIRDISERFKNERKRLELEQQLLHVQKKEIIGTLSSGIAHDILNILGIIGTAINKLLFLKNIDHTTLKETAEPISKATERGQALVKQLLTFAKKTELNFDSTQVNEPVTEIVNVIRRTFPNTIMIESRLNENHPLIRADNNQLHQALLNLCLNARDAIRGHGTIIIETTMKSAMRLNGALGKHGEYICISVTDDGIGMTPDVLQRIYEPFFTTKDDGTGSGLGLAMVKGIVENHRGFIDVESEPDKGTTFRMYFPV